MYYLEEDVGYLIYKHWRKFGRLDAGVNAVEYLVKTGRDYNKFLVQYPSVRCEQLDFHYEVLQSLGAFNSFLLTDFIDCGYRGAIWGAFLVSINPKEEFLPLLSECELTHQQWIIDFAISEIQNEKLPQFSKLSSLLVELRSLYANISLPEVNLRREPDESQMALIQVERESIRKVYRAKGREAALEEFKKSKYRYYWLDARRWSKERTR